MEIGHFPFFSELGKMIAYGGKFKTLDLGNLFRAETGIEMGACWYVYTYPGSFQAPA